MQRAELKTLIISQRKSSMKKNKLLFTVIVLCIIAVVCVIAYYAMPIIYHSKQYIHNRLLKDTPIGSDKKQVLEYIKKTDYRIDSEVQCAYEEQISAHREIGDSYVKVYVGHYQGIPWKCDVGVVWVFDKDEKLIHIDVWKEYDAL